MAAPHLKIITYLTFSGNCREAMTFYKDCLGGELVFHTLGESPFSGDLPGNMKKAVLQATLTKGELLLLGTDMVGEGGAEKGQFGFIDAELPQRDRDKGILYPPIAGWPAITSRFRDVLRCAAG